MHVLHRYAHGYCHRGILCAMCIYLHKRWLLESKIPYEGSQNVWHGQLISCIKINMQCGREKLGTISHCSKTI